MSNTGKRAGRGLFKFVAFLNSKAMRALDWSAALVCIFVGVYLVRSTDAPTASDWMWLAGGVVGMLFAIFRPVQRAATGLSLAVRRSPSATKK